MSNQGLEIRIPRQEQEPALVEFFSTLTAAGEDAHFHPHALTPEAAHERCTYIGKDLYYVILEKQKVLGYGMLRGWDNGHQVPSLGIALRASERGSGLAAMFVHFLHTAARRHGANRVILNVYRSNVAAIRLYKKLGYTLTDNGDTQLRGTITL
ncbi:MAG: GNAT family N-acetyltransferase [Pseudomonadota bacterium]